MSSLMSNAMCSCMFINRYNISCASVRHYEVIEARLKQQALLCSRRHPPRILHASLQINPRSCVSWSVSLLDCDEKHWGDDCSHFCECENGGQCDPLSGSCQCRLGYTGRHCEDPCPPGKFGKDCLQKCLCGIGGSCDKETGGCYCKEGFTGTL